MRGRHEDIIHDKVLAAGAAHADGGPGVHDGRLFYRKPHGANFRSPLRGQLRLLAIHDEACAIEPLGVIYATREVPLSLDTIAIIDRIGVTQRT